jgi:hypothetical protein
MTLHDKDNRIIALAKLQSAPDSLIDELDNLTFLGHGGNDRPRPARGP